MTAHPRSRGENLIGVAADLAAQGSSPLTRGKLSGIIQIWTSALAHPRSRGENVSQRAGGKKVAGSSPLTRGKRHDGVERGPRDRLIPAHAGKTLSDLRFYRTDRSDLGKP